MLTASTAQFVSDIPLEAAPAPSRSLFLSMKPGSLHKELIQVGILAISTFSFLVVVSLRPIRKAAYELFFILHFFMVLCVRFLRS